MYGELAEEQEGEAHSLRFSPESLSIAINASSASLPQSFVEADEPYPFGILGSPVSDSSARNVAIPCGVRSSAGESAKERDDLCACVVPLIFGLAVALGLIGTGEGECKCRDRAVVREDKIIPCSLIG